METQVIHASKDGPEYTWPITITETNGKDISGCTVEICLGTYDDPGTWTTPDVDKPQDDKATRVVQLLVNDQTAGRYHVWTRVADDPEKPIRRHQMITVT